MDDSVESLNNIDHPVYLVRSKRRSTVPPWNLLVIRETRRVISVKSLVDLAGTFVFNGHPCTSAKRQKVWASLILPDVPSTCLRNLARNSSRTIIRNYYECRKQ